ncbi:hypothetical protein V498_10146 [Pseudogymnoascus sp. VKM F-4517 (FW-2822)]|nr:hypothetical protein V498_10146 [Pseudogymnoascus sp. VKM F-4517 (FW-2822)]
MSSLNSAVGKTICDVSLECLLQSRSLDISKCGTPGRYRLVSCADFIDSKKLTIHGYTEFPEDPFAAVSYVWRGNTPEKDFDGRVFDVPIQQVEGAEPGDHIGVEVLHEACVASIACGGTHLWLDRLCIIQMGEDDKKWQISGMYKIYQRSHACIVTPGGIRCLVPLDKETQ